MGFLNILGYIGVGLAAALVLLVISFLWSRPKETVLYEDGSMYKQRGNGDWGVAYGISVLIMCILAILLFYNLAHFSIIKSIGLGVVATIALHVITTISGVIIGFKTSKRSTAEEKDKRIYFIVTFILCMLNGAAFAVLVSVWGWF